MLILGFSGVTLFSPALRPLVVRRAATLLLPGLAAWSAAMALASGLTDPQAPVLSAASLAAPPVIDGTIGTDEWGGAAAVNTFQRLSDGEFLASAPTVRIGFDDRCLYLAAVVPVAVGSQPRAVARGRDGPVWADDAIEVFLDPTHDHQTPYQFLVNSGGAQADLRDQDLGWNGEWSVAASVQAMAWAAEIAIPWPTLGLGAPADGTVLGLNLGWDRQGPAVSLGSWAPLSGSFHQPARFGHLVLRRQGPAVSVLLPAATSAVSFSLQRVAGNAVPLAALLSLARGGTALGSQSAQLTDAVDVSMPLPVREGRIDGGEFRCALEVTAKGEPLPVARVAGLVRVRPPLGVTLRRHFLTSGRLVVELDASGLRSELADPSFDVSLCAADGTVVTHQQRGAADDGKASLEFDLTPVAPGAYRVRAAALDASGDPRATAEVPFTKPEPPSWLHSRAGISDKVLPPWTPLKVKSSAGRVTVASSGRRYHFSGGVPLPDAIETAGAAVLARPIRLRLQVDSQPLELAGTLAVVKRTRAQVVLRGVTQRGPVTVTSQLAVDFDGNARLDLQLAAVRPTRLDEFSIEVPLRREYCRYRYFFPGTWGSSANAGALPAEGWRSRFVPYVWVGDEDRGVALYTESDEHWRPTDPERAVEVVPEDQAMVLRFNVVGTPCELGGPQQPAGLPFTFGFVATPVKEPDADVWDYRICHSGSYGLEKQMALRPTALAYPAEIGLDPQAGTLEMWVRVRFDPNAAVTDYASRGALNRDLLTISGGQDTLGLYWNVDDRGMRVYLRRGETHPVVVGAASAWQEGERHHLALSWGKELRVYVDGTCTVRADWQGSVAAPPGKARIEFGGRQPGFELDEVRLSVGQREPEVCEQPYRANEQTLLLDHLDRLTDAAGGKATVPEKGAPGILSGAPELVPGRFGQALALAAGTPKPMLDYLRDLGVRTIVFHEHWTEYQNATDTIAHAAELKSLVQACHQRGLKLLLYFGYLMADICPEWELYRDDVLVLPQQGEYVREPAQKDYTVCYASAWQDYIADGIAKLMDKYDIDGVYLDGTQYPWACTNRSHGCGYTRPDGSQAPTFGIFAARDMVRRIYTIVKTKKPDGQVNCHNSTCMTIPTLGWATSSWDGEQFGSIARGADVTRLLPLDAFRCEFMGRQWGVPAEFLCYDRPYTAHQALSFTLLHDVLVRGSGPSLEEEAKLWQVMDEFGRKRAELLPYWSNGDLAQVSPAGAYATLYARPGKGVMAVVSNLGTATAEVRVVPAAAKLGLKEPVAARNALTGESIPVVGGAFTVRLEVYDYALVRLGQAER